MLLRAARRLPAPTLRPEQLSVLGARATAPTLRNIRPVLARRLLSTEAEAPAGEVDLQELRTKTAEAKEQLADLTAQLKTLKEDSQQAVKRHETDLQNESKYGITKFAKAMLQIPDNLERAIGSVKQEDVDQDKELMKLRDGVARMQTVVKEAIGKHGVVKMDAEDKPFNPDQHEAMFAMEMPGKDANFVFHVMEPGYMIHDRTLRAAKVGVTK